MSNYKTVFQEAESLDIVNKSKFIGYCKPIESQEEAQKFIEVIRKKHWDASHNVPVYILGDRSQIQKCSDDGEPSGTAGAPILNLLKAQGITNLVIVVTRYFGGTKLGTGGLVRAYSQSAKSVLEAAKVIEMLNYDLLSLKMNYTLHGKCQNYLQNNQEYLVKETLYTDLVEVLVYVRSDETQGFTDHLINLTNDQCAITHMDEVMLPISDDQWIK